MRHVDWDLKFMYFWSVFLTRDVLHFSVDNVLQERLLWFLVLHNHVFWLNIWHWCIFCLCFCFLCVFTAPYLKKSPYNILVNCSVFNHTVICCLLLSIGPPIRSRLKLDWIDCHGNLWRHSWSPVDEAYWLCSLIYWMDWHKHFYRKLWLNTTAFGEPLTFPSGKCQPMSLTFFWFWVKCLEWTIGWIEFWCRLSCSPKNQL